MKDKIKELLSSPGFRERARKFLGALSAHLNKTKIGALIPLETALGFVEKSDPRDLELLRLNGLGRELADILERHARENEALYVLDANLNKTSQDAIRDLLAEPVTLPRNTVRQFLQQDAIQQLFVSIIHDSIINFNKKVNPFAGAMAALGMESQIKNFITPFMSQVVDSAADFVVSDQNQVLFSRLAVAMFDIVKKEKPGPYLGAIRAAQKKKLDAAVLALAGDEKLIEFQRKVARHAVAEFHPKVADLTLGDLFTINPADFAAKYADLTLQITMPILQSDVVLDYLLNEVKEILN